MQILTYTEYTATKAEAATSVMASSSPTLACPSCGDRGLVRSQPRWWDAAIRAVTNRRPFRCFSCQSRRWWDPQDVMRPGVSSPVRLP